MAAAAQTHCDRCRAPLVRDAAYCESCGERTHRAKRMVRLAIRVEILFVILVALLVVGFTYVFYVQKP
jgi:predicted nucleic acid-binding Zn ribbon protein